MTKRTPQLETAILEGFACGRSIYEMCREHGIATTTFHHWKRSDPDFARRYDEARPDHADALIDEAMRIAEVPTSAWVEEMSSGEAGIGDHIRHARLRIQTRLRIAQIHRRRHEATVERQVREKPPATASAQPAAAEPESGAGEAPQYADFAEALEANYQRLIREGPRRPRARPSYLTGGDPSSVPPAASPSADTEAQAPYADAQIPEGAS